MRLSISIANQSDFPIPRRLIEDVRSLLMRTQFFPWNLELSIALLNTREMRTVNNRFRGKDKATNVISVFLDDATEPPSKIKTVHGEILLCPTVLKAEAEAEGVSYREHFSRMLIHGMIHVRGIDHERSAAEESSALQLEESLVRSLFPRRSH